MEIKCFLPKLHGGTGLYRIRIPHEILDNASFYLYDPQVPITLQDLKADILFVSKSNFIPVLPFLPDLKASGTITILDFDDYWVLPQDHMLYSNYKKFGTTKILTDALRSFDYITCTTEILADKIRPINNNVVVFENAVNPMLAQFQGKPRQSDILRFGWIGGHCHLPDIKLLEGVHDQLSLQSNKFEIQLFGHDGRTPSVYDEFAHIMGGRTQKHLKVYRAASADTYTKFYNLVDVSLIPLRDSLFNSMKSELKLVESAFFKKAVIVSNVMPYKKWLTPKNSLVADKQNDWIKQMKRCIGNPSLVEDLGNQLYEDLHVKFNVFEVNKRRIEFYDSICK